jgi:pseudouridine synthase
VASRRRCDDLIHAGRVSVNGSLVTELGTRVDPSRDSVQLDGRPVAVGHRRVTVALHKPPGVLVSSRDARGRTTVMNLLPATGPRVFPVGRLDFKSEGLLLLTNDGELGFRLAHPRFKVEKLYHVEIEGNVPQDVIESLQRGVVLEEGPTQPAHVTILRRTKRRTLLAIELKEGRKRQIRRMLAAFGYAVLVLRRVRIGPIEIGALGPGSWRELSETELAKLRRAVGLEAKPKDVSI